MYISRCWFLAVPRRMEDQKEGDEGRLEKPHWPPTASPIAPGRRREHRAPNQHPQLPSTWYPIYALSRFTKPVPPSAEIGWGLRETRQGGEGSWITCGHPPTPSRSRGGPVAMQGRCLPQADLVTISCEMALGFDLVLSIRRPGTEKGAAAGPKGFSALLSQYFVTPSPLSQYFVTPIRRALWPCARLSCASRTLRMSLLLLTPVPIHACIHGHPYTRRHAHGVAIIPRCVQ